ncbi:hypothetical protein ACFTWD_31540 [Streptomyces sp. NPDC056943]|uniref:hypothetical protein n=1 Tax=Streptomyces sp. NPDC056943 TaxID=3345971 RepID=UPI00363C605C
MTARPLQRVAGLDLIVAGHRDASLPQPDDRDRQVSAGRSRGVALPVLLASRSIHTTEATREPRLRSASGRPAAQNRVHTRQDPLVDNNSGSGQFPIPERPIRRRVTGLPAFVVTLGGEYFFIPSLTALGWLSRMPH